MDSFQMMVTPVASKKRGHEDDEDQIKRRNNVILLKMNRDIEDCKCKFKIDEIEGQKSHEVPLLVILSDPDAKGLLLFMLRNESFIPLCSVHGMQISGQNRGDSMRVIINTKEWKRFSNKEMEEVFDGRSV